MADDETKPGQAGAAPRRPDPGASAIGAAGSGEAAGNADAGTVAIGAAGSGEAAGNADAGTAAIGAAGSGEAAGNAEGSGGGSADGGERHWFGSEAVDGAEKRRRVSNLFTSVAERYDLMNDLMSLGMHRLWKRFFLGLARLRPEHQVLEIAAGSSDLAQLVFTTMKEPPRFLATDINRAMLEQGRDRLIDKGHVLPFVQADAEFLPVADSSIDRVFLSFGLRNVADQRKCLSEIRRVLKDGGMALIMEFSMDLPESLVPLYDIYSMSWLPRLGRWMADNEDGYRYLAESIRKQPRCAQMRELLAEIGFSEIRTNKLALGAVTLYRACP